ncbi:MAG TPA: type III-B CRISPR-associated protein Cas10/Cmr2, partial [Spirochaetota bacterium]|nr:type III-B CRISPR-associated protein Cas10/Cmr2 [Spirochaetota bacterium]
LKHERVAYDLYNFLISGSPFDDVIKKADVLASGLTRILVSPLEDDSSMAKEFSEESSVFYDDSIFIDCFSGNKQVCEAPESHKDVQEVFEKLGKLRFVDTEERERFYFLFLWRFLPEIFPWINTHPADSRVPNHSIYDHLVQTSAIASCLNGGDSPAFLLWTLGPVQSFIESAKKTSDLWAGSFLLSYLTFTAIRVVMEEIGPDNIIFPNLIGQPLVDRWLYDYFKSTDIDIQCFRGWKQNWKIFFDKGFKDIEEKITIANIPNRFLAVVPSSKATELAKRCSDVVKDALKNLSKDEKLKIEDIESFFNFYWVVLPWLGDKAVDITNLIESYNELTGKSAYSQEDKELSCSQIAEFVTTHPLYKTKENVSFNSQIGIAYSLLAEMSERILASRKNMRDFVNIQPQLGKKCNICGEYSSITKEEEALCSICMLKRRLPYIMKDELSLQNTLRFPSTSEMAIVRYKEELPEEIADELISKLTKLKCKDRLNESVSVPKLKGNKLYKIDGQFLMPFSYRKEYFVKEYGFTGEQQELDGIKKVLSNKEKFKVQSPVYYAILAMDGDEMGKWISGSKNPPIRELLHKKTISALEAYWTKGNKVDITAEKFLNSRHPMTPSFHSAFSRRLSNFALEDVRKIVEEDFYGKLIYAGGDDVLAFLPVEDALPCAVKLHNSFSKFFGKNGSMSAGIVFVHHKYPLQMALRDVREAEKKAKNLYKRGAFCLSLIKNSGENRTIGLKWGSEEMEFFQKLISIYKNLESSSNKDKGQLPSKFGYDFMDIVREFLVEDSSFSSKKEGKDEFLRKILLKELRRIYRQKFQKNGDVDLENKMLKLFNEWQYNYDEFANMFIIARFMGLQGREV